MPQGILASHAGKGSGIIIDIGEDITQITPIIEGYILKGGTRKLDIGGRNISDCLFQLLQKKHTIDDNILNREKIREIKHVP